jgi:hypothetical protein
MGAVLSGGTDFVVARVEQDAIQLKGVGCGDGRAADITQREAGLAKIQDLHAGEFFAQ